MADTHPSPMAALHGFVQKPWMWWFSCGITATNGAWLISVSSDGNFYPRWGMGLGAALVIASIALLSQRAWSARHPDLVLLPFSLYLMAYSSLYADRHEWVGAFFGACGLVAIPLLLLSVWNERRQSPEA